MTKRQEWFIRLKRIVSDAQTEESIKRLARWTQGKIERWYQTLKNRIVFEYHYLPVDLNARIEAFVANHNLPRYHETLSNPTPARPSHPAGKGINQTPDHRTPAIAAPENAA